MLECNYSKSVPRNTNLHYRLQINMAISGLSIKITIPIVLISAMAIGLTAFLNHGKFERTFTELESSRIQFVVNDIRANLETGLGMGLPLNGLANAQAVIDFEARKDPSILSISVYDETGAVVFHTGRSMGGTTVPKSWKPITNAKSERDWQITEPDAFVVGTGLSGILGAQTGGLALRYSRQAHDGVVDSVAHALKLASIVGIVCTALIAILGIHLLVARTHRRLQGIEYSLAPAAMEGAEISARKATSEAVVLVAGVINSSRAAMQDLTAGKQTLRGTLDTKPPGERR
jgi:hypothetical protein